MRWSMVKLQAVHWYGVRNMSVSPQNGNGTIYLKRKCTKTANGVINHCKLLIYCQCVNKCKPVRGLISSLSLTYISPVRFESLYITKHCAILTILFSSCTNSSMFSRQSESVAIFASREIWTCHVPPRCNMLTYSPKLSPLLCFPTLHFFNTPKHWHF